MHHGLILPQHVLSLPAIDAKNSPPIRTLPLSTFSSLHLSHILSHPPDHILFPFLHGLEGDNAAQNTFFSGANVRVPAYRGLVWVVCEDDLVGDETRFEKTLKLLRRRGENTAGMESASESGSTSESESGSSAFDDDDDDEHMHIEGVYTEPRVIPMDIDADVDVDPTDCIRVVVEPTMKEDKHTHMHPVVQRPTPIQIQTANLKTDSDSISTATRSV